MAKRKIKRQGARSAASQVRQVRDKATCLIHTDREMRFVADQLRWECPAPGCKVIAFPKDEITGGEPRMIELDDGVLIMYHFTEDDQYALRLGKSSQFVAFTPDDLDRIGVEFRPDDDVVILVIPIKEMTSL